jgi:hypothetical protein
MAGEAITMTELHEEVAEPPVGSNDAVTMSAQYIRLSMFVLVVVLGVSIAAATLRPGGELEGSISDYFHTPARLVLVATLLAIGVCLMALYSTNRVENFLLNAAGAICPIIGFAATTQDTGSRPPFDFDVSTQDVNTFAEISLPAYFVGLLVLAVLVYVVHPPGTGLWKSALTVALIVGLAVGTWMLWSQAPRKVHSAAAFGFFIPLIVLILAKARDASVGPALRMTYRSIGVLMVAAGLWYWFDRTGGGRWEYATLVVECVLIVCFALFWLLEYLRVHGVQATAARTAQGTPN